MVRQEDRPAQRRAVVLIDPRPSAHGGTGASSSFEWAVTAAASVAVHLCDSGYAVHLVCAETVETSRAAETMTPDEILDVLAVATLRDDTGEDEILRAGQALAAAGGFLVAIVGPSGRDVTSRVASLRQPGTTGLALVLDARSFGTSRRRGGRAARRRPSPRRVAGRRGPARRGRRARLGPADGRDRGRQPMTRRRWRITVLAALATLSAVYPITSLFIETTWLPQAFFVIPSSPGSASSDGD